MIGKTMCTDVLILFAIFIFHLNFLNLNSEFSGIFLAVMTFQVFLSSVCDIKYSMLPLDLSLLSSII